MRCDPDHGSARGSRFRQCLIEPAPASRPALRTQRPFATGRLGESRWPGPGSVPPPSASRSDARHDPTSRQTSAIGKKRAASSRNPLFRERNRGPLQERRRLMRLLSAYQQSANPLVPSQHVQAVFDCATNSGAVPAYKAQCGASPGDCDEVFSTTRFGIPACLCRVLSGKRRWKDRAAAAAARRSCSSPRGWLRFNAGD